MIVAVGTSSGFAAGSNTFSVTVPSTFSITAGQTLTATPGTITGGAIAHFGDSETVTFHLDTAGGMTIATSPSTVTTSSSGSASGITFSIPASVANGNHALVAVGGTTGNTAVSNTFTVTVVRTCTLSATGDTDIVSSSSSPNGSATTMITNPQVVRNALVQFGILASPCAEGGTIPAGATINSASLTLVHTPTSGSTRVIGATLAGATWAESALTWATATTAMRMPTGGTTQTVTPSATTVTWTVTASVQSIANGAPDGGWVLWDTGSGNQARSFNTKEATSGKPSLVISYH
jgi:hypothetical protein